MNALKPGTVRVMLIVCAVLLVVGFAVAGILISQEAQTPEQELVEIDDYPVAIW